MRCMQVCWDIAGMERVWFAPINTNAFQQSHTAGGRAWMRCMPVCREMAGMERVL